MVRGYSRENGSVPLLRIPMVLAETDEAYAWQPTMFMTSGGPRKLIATGSVEFKRRGETVFTCGLN